MKTRRCVIFVGLWNVSPATGAAGQGLFAPINEKCGAEQSTYCFATGPSNMGPGNTHPTPYLYAHENKLPAACAATV